jgi:hypothetical protein
MLVGDLAYNLEAVLKVLDGWNDKIQEDSDGWFEDNGMIPFTVVYFSEDWWIQYNGLHLFDTRDDDRRWDDEEVDTEALETYLIRKVDEINKQFGGVKL